MDLRFKKSFQKSARKLSPSQLEQMGDRLELFLQNPYLSLLNNHRLGGKYADFRSINISGDLRALYFIDRGCYVFVYIGTHSQLYE